MNLFFILYENISILLSVQTFLLFLYLCNCIHKTRNRQSQQTVKDIISVEPIKKPIIKYEDKYKEQYIKMQPFCLSTVEKDNLKNNFIMEHTPLGNVIMYYNNEKNGFVYYSDSTIPYRFLETVGRKYMITFKCRDTSIFFDDSDDISNDKENTDNIENTKPIVTNKELIKTDDAPKTKLPKNVFAKFKNYNHPNSIPSASLATKNSQITNTSTNQKIKEVKENKNKYISEGKIVNFSFLKKVDKKQIIKRLNMTFAEFKKLQLESKK
jgi:hypothetical protein